MKNYIVRRYEPEDFAIWNAFVGSAKNATFLFHRGFMEYHKDRFEDFSLMIFENEKLVSVIPANRLGDVVYSHQGLTYGGFVFQKKVKGNEIFQILEKFISFLKDEQIKRFISKDIISIYTQFPSNEIGCFLVQKGAAVYRRDLNLALDFKQLNLISKSKLKHYRRVLNLGLKIQRQNTFDDFWDNVLMPRLKERFEAKPVHSKNEIAYLHKKFPDNILQYNVYYDDEIVAGITLFKFDNVIKSQYGATTIKGEKLRALDFLYMELIQEYKEDFCFFDMGTVTENEGKSFNAGLLNQKEELGCSIYNQDFYELIL